MTFPKYEKVQQEKEIDTSSIDWEKLNAEAKEAWFDKAIVRLGDEFSDKANLVFEKWPKNFIDACSQYIEDKGYQKKITFLDNATKAKFTKDDGSTEILSEDELQEIYNFPKNY